MYIPEVINMDELEYIKKLENLIGLVLHRFGKCRATHFDYMLSEAKVGWGDLHREYHKEEDEL